MNLKRVQVNILIVFILLILASISQELLIKRRLRPGEVAIELNLKDHNSSCVYSSRHYFFILNNCKEYPKGSILAILGRVDEPLDRDFFNKNWLTVQSIELINHSRSSVKNRIFFYFNPIFWFKSFLLRNFSLHLTEPHSGLVVGMVFGGIQQLSGSLSNAFRVTGMSHVVSASGFNLSVILGMLLLIFNGLSRKMTFFVSLPLIFAYTLVSGVVPAVVRAAGMASISLLGSKLFYRQYHPGLALAITSGLMLITRPSYLAEISFQLSIMATLGIILVLPKLSSSGGFLASLERADLNNLSFRLSGNHQANKIRVVLEPFREAFLVTVSAQSLTLPLVLFHFAELSTISLVANTALLWLTPLITITGLVFMLVAAVFSFLPGIFASLLSFLSVLVWLPTEVFLRGVLFFGQFERSLLNIGEFSWWMVVAWWLTVGWWVLKQQHRES